MMHSPAHEDRLIATAPHEQILQRGIEILQCARQLAVLSAMGAAAARARDLETLLRTAIEDLLTFLPFEAGAIYLREELPDSGSRAPVGPTDRSTLHLRVHRGIPPSFTEMLARVPLGEGPIGEAAALGAPLFIEFSTSRPPLYRNLMQRAGFHSFLLIPLRAEEQTLGVLLLLGRNSAHVLSGEGPSREPRPESPRQQTPRLSLAEYSSAFFSALGDLLGTAIARARRYEHLAAERERESHRAERWHRAARILKMLAAVSVPCLLQERAPATSERTREILSEACRLLQEAFGFPTVSVFLLDESAQELILAAIRSRYARPLSPGYRHSIYVGTLGWVARHGEVLLANDVSAEPRFVRAHAETKAQLDLAMRCEGRTLGVLSIESDRQDAFDQEDVALLQVIADHLALHLHTVRTVEELREHLERASAQIHAYGAALDVLEEGFAILQDKRLREANRRMAELTGLSRGELLALESVLDLFSEEERDRARTLLEREASEKTPRAAQLHLRRKGGGEIAVQAIVRPIVYEGKPALCLILETRKDHPPETPLQEEKLTALERFVSGVAHELNNPLTSVLGYAELLLTQEPLSERAQRDLHTIREQAQRAKKVIQNLLTFARFYRPEKEVIDLNEVIRAALEAYRLHTPMSPLRVRTNLSPDLPLIRADRNLLQQVFSNIILNAEHAVREARGHGTLLIETRRKLSSEGDPSDEVIEIRFTDDGPGIPASHLPRIFDPFFTTKPPGVGTGLGLSICYGIIKEHGGEIYAVSEEGRGATFIIELPLSPRSEPKDPPFLDRSSRLR